jgi:23S rRNA pseudouridine2605 synthase
VGRFTAPPRYDLSGYEEKNKKSKVKKHTDSDILRLNRYIANAGICSRREADSLIESGQIIVNGKVITEMGYKVKRSDTVKYDKKVLNPERSVYVLINKPKDYITTTEDPEERKTVLDLVGGACEERIYPVGRLDRNTTGLLLLTNDGELAEKLTHPSSNIKKIYQAELDKPITTEDFESLQSGLKLEDGFIKPDAVSIITPDAMVVGLEIHSGRNRIVRRMFEHLGYEVKKLDRTVFAGLNKKDLPRGKWRFLSEKEVVRLKFML